MKGISTSFINLKSIWTTTEKRLRVCYNRVLKRIRELVLIQNLTNLVWVISLKWTQFWEWTWQVLFRMTRSKSCMIQKGTNFWTRIWTSTSLLINPKNMIEMPRSAATFWRKNSRMMGSTKVICREKKGGKHARNNRWREKYPFITKTGLCQEMSSAEVAVDPITWLNKPTVQASFLILSLRCLRAN